MNKLIAELQRLYFLPGQAFQSPDADDAAAAPELLVLGGMTRAMVLSFARGADWEHAASLCQAVQDELELPAPAVSVSGSAGYQLWFSLAEPLPFERVAVFLEALQRRYLPALRPAHLGFWPGGGAKVLNVPPALHAGSGKWSAFIDPGLGSMFSEEPGLGMSPALDRQADLLAGLASIKAGAFERTLELLQDQSETMATGRAHEPASPLAPLNVGGHFADPKSFLLALMNDSSASTDQRIEAARALLPYFP